MQEARAPGAGVRRRDQTRTHAHRQTGRQAGRQTDNKHIRTVQSLSHPSSQSLDMERVTHTSWCWRPLLGSPLGRRSARSTSTTEHEICTNAEQDAPLPVAASAVPPGGTTPHPASCPSLAATCPSSTMPASACTHAPFADRQHMPRAEGLFSLHRHDLDVHRLRLVGRGLGQHE